MAVITNHRDYSVPQVKIGPKTSQALYYVFIGIVAMSIAIPAALMTADASLFEECFQACAAVQ